VARVAPAAPAGSVPCVTDVSVRLAAATDADRLADLQVGCWRAGYRDLLPATALDELAAGQPEIAERWREAVLTPPSPRHRVLVACEAEAVVGAAALGPAEDADRDPARDGELLTVLVQPGHRRVGHGSRLLAASVDQLRSVGFERATTWLDAADDAARTLLVSAGWGPDGSHRTLDLDGDGTVVLAQVRLHTDLGG
jgi:GNAT superfamily N-acetyltransferase